MSVYVEKDGPVTTVILSRPEVRNAVDRQTARALAEAFRTFEADEQALVAVFSGDPRPVHWHQHAGRVEVVLGERAEQAGQLVRVDGVRPARSTFCR